MTTHHVLIKERESTEENAISFNINMYLAVIDIQEDMQLYLISPVARTLALLNLVRP